MRKNEIKNKLVSLQSKEGISAQPKKAAYLSPVLQVYGSVSKLTMGATGSKSDGTLKKVCDRSVKENIAKIGEHPLGIGLYLFDYKSKYRDKAGYSRQFGVMADEVEGVMPEAVCIHPDGYKMVIYGMLGIKYPVQ